MANVAETDSFLDYSGITVLCVGDIMLDRYIFGTISRSCPECPHAPVFLSDNGPNAEMTFLGGAGNVAATIASLGGKANLVGTLGDDAAGREIKVLLKGVDAIKPLLILNTRPRKRTVVKTRYIVRDSKNGEGCWNDEQVMRVDEEDTSEVASDREGLSPLLQAIDEGMQDAQVVIVSDYAKGLLIAPVLQYIMKRARNRSKERPNDSQHEQIPVFVDPKIRKSSSWVKSSDEFLKQYAKYTGATCLTPNLSELLYEQPSSDTGERVPVKSILAGAMEIVKMTTSSESLTSPPTVLVTRSKEGMLLVEPSGRTTEVASFATKVVDVAGAGDTVIATLALSYASGQSLPQAMGLASAAAAVVVGKAYNRNVTIPEIKAILNELDKSTETLSKTPPLSSQKTPIEILKQEELTRSKIILSLTELDSQVKEWRSQNLKIGLANGCIDIVHPGHVYFFDFSKDECDRLIVALNSDASIKRLKGPSRPVHSFEHRAGVVAGLRSVDCVVGFEENTPIELIKRVLPDVLIKGKGHDPERGTGVKEVKDAGGRVIIAEVMPEYSTTKSILKVRGQSL